MCVLASGDGARGMQGLVEGRMCDIRFGGGKQRRQNV